MALGIKSSMMLKEAEGPLEAPKFVKRKVHQKSDRTKLVGQRVLSLLLCYCAVRMFLLKYIIHELP